MRDNSYEKNVSPVSLGASLDGKICSLQQQILSLKTSSNWEGIISQGNKWGFIKVVYLSLDRFFKH